MKERPILFNDQMVRAILEGRKTVTRRAVKDTGFYAIDAAIHGNEVALREREALSTRCPFGQPGDRLWVRETFADIGCRLTFRADLEDGAHCSVTRWTPSLHMPRWASRILLEITAVRVERLQQITIGEICKEGLARSMYEFIPVTTAFDAFAELWNSTGGDWDANPLGLGHRVQAGDAVNTRRTTIWLGSLFGGLLYLFILAAGPIWGGIITAEATHLSAAGR